MAVSADAADGAPWLELVPVPNPIVVDRNVDRDEPPLSLELVSRVSRGVRVESVDVVYLKGEVVLAARPQGSGFFEEGGLPRANSIEAGSRESWTGICLTALPADADAVRLDLGLVSRLGVPRSRSRQSIVVPIAAAPAPVPLRLPFRGHWRVTQGHGCGSNHRLGARGAEFAWDFATVDRDEGGRRSGYGAGFGRDVLAPVDGRVVRVVADVEDNRGMATYPRRSLLDDLRRPDWVYGNYLVIEAGGTYVLLGHLERGSPLPAVGERVEAGAVVARVGNSGNAIDAHIHLHVMDGPDPADPAVRGLPARLADYVEIRAASKGEASEIVVRRVAAGDPPEGSVVAPDAERRPRPRP